jgi:hypothetical protein
MKLNRLGALGDVLWVAALAVVSSAWCVTAAGRLGATFDEPYFVGAGLKSWHAGTTKSLVDTGTAPGPMLMDTLPLVVWERWTGRKIDTARDSELVLTVCRAGTLAFWWLLLGYAYVAGRQLGGPWAGRLAAALLAAEPSFLAHAGLATADIAVTAVLLAFWVHARAGRGRPWPWRVGLPGLLYGLALFQKISALPLALIGLAVIEFDDRLRRVEDGDGGWRSWPVVAWRAWFNRRFFRDIVQVFWIGIAVLFLLCGTDWKPSPSFVKWADGLPAGATSQSMRWLAEHLAVFSNAGNALGYQIRHNMRGHSAFLLGTSWPRAVWYYFPVVLSIKLSLGLLALPLVLMIVNRRALRNWACWLTLALLLFSLNCRVQTGVRFMLPLVAAAVVGLAAALVLAARASGVGWQRWLLRTAGVIAPLWAAWSAIAVWPNGLCFVNEFWGGPADGYRLVCDSNYDWGQGLPELAAWSERNGPVDVLYFGTDQPPAHSGVHKLEAVAFSKADATELRRVLSARYLAVGTTVLYSPLSLEPMFHGVIEMLRKVTPRDRTTTFLIYRVDDFPEERAEGPAPTVP